MKKILLTIFAAFFFVSPSYTVASQKKKPLKSLLFRIFSKAQKPVETLGESPELKFIKVFRESEDLSLSCIFRRSERLCVPTFLEPKQPFQTKRVRFPEACLVVLINFIELGIKRHARLW